MSFCNQTLDNTIHSHVYTPSRGLLSRALHLRALIEISHLISYKIFSKHSLYCKDLKLVVVTHQYAVEELVYTKAQDTHHQVDDVVHEPKVCQHLPRLLGERALVPHHTYQIYPFIYHLHTKKKTCFIIVLHYEAAKDTCKYPESI